MDEEAAAIKLQCAYRGHLALRKVRNVAKDIYVKETDPESGYSFYLNKVTGVSTWDKPRILGSDDISKDGSIALYEENQLIEQSNSSNVQPFYDYDTEHLEAAEAYGYDHMGEVDEYGHFIVQEEQSGVVDEKQSKKSKAIKQNRERKKIKVKSWVAVFKENELRPWQCILCKRPNRAHNPTCLQCGKKKPPRPNLRDVAAKMIQKSWRTHVAWNRMRKMIEDNYEKLWDGKAKRYYYFNKTTKEKSFDKPIILQKNGNAEDDIELSPRSKKLEEDRYYRNLGMKEREEKFRIQRKMEKEQEEIEANKHWESQWKLSLSEANRTGELLNCWKGLDRIHINVFTMKHLTAVRLIGHSLKHIPDEFCNVLTNLTSVSFSNNLLESLPQNIGNLGRLTELNVLKNKLRYLPESLCVLKKLERLDMCNNKLQRLPEHFGALSSLEGVLTIEVNELTEVPDSIGDLSVSSLRLSRNALLKMPSSLSRLTSLTSLVINGNRLDQFPNEVCLLPKIRHISLCRNNLTNIAENIGDCQYLRNLWLDWNKIAIVPDSIANCKHLQYIKLEGNPMRQPAFDVISQGTMAIRKFCQIRLKYSLNRKRVRIVRDLQNMFGLIEQFNLGDKFDDMLSLTPAPPHDQDGYFGFVLDRFFPSNKYEDAMFPKIQKVIHETSQLKSHRIRDFNFTIDEVIDALENISDPLGQIGHAQIKLNFRRCSCKKRDGTRKVCIPPGRGWNCRRRGCLIKKTTMSAHDYHKQVQKANDKVKVKRQVALASSTAWRYIRSAAGVKAMLTLALTMAQEQREGDRVKRFVDKRMKKALANDKYHRARRARRLKTLQERKTRRLNDLTKRREKLLHKKEALRGWELEKCEEEIDSILEKLERSPEDEEIARIHEDNEDADAELADAKTAATQAAGFKPLTEAQKKRPDAALLKLAHSLLQKATLKYVEEQKQLAKEKAMRETALMAHIYDRWQRSDMKMIFEAWREVALVMIEVREYLGERAEEADEHKKMTDYVDTLLVRMEQEKWVEHWDEFNEKYYYIHSETGVQKDFIPEDEKYVPRTLRDERGKHIGESSFLPWLTKREHHTHYPKGMEEAEEKAKQEFFQMVDDKYDESTKYLENYVDGYDAYDGEGYNGDDYVTGEVPNV
eukprot:g1418.t1